MGPERPKRGRRTGAPPAFRLASGARAAMTARAEADYPEETCGLVFSRGAELEVCPMENIQNKLHREDPVQHPRDARRAYFMDPWKMQCRIDEREKAGYRHCAIYHSHPDEDSYFSETDSAAAAPFGEPGYPGVVYLVFSVRQGKVVDLKAFDWSAPQEGYVEVPIVERREPGGRSSR